MQTGAVRERAATLSREPGVYQFLDGDRVLYVGKAVDLRDRVRSYADPRSERVREMVRRAASIDVAVTDTETQALLLEANLIKRHQPRYNVRLKDDKSYPLVQLTDHRFPRIEITRDPDPGATAYGPYTDKGQLETVQKAIREVAGLRGCSDHKFQNRDRPCLDHDMGLCAAPCTGEIDAATYADRVELATRFFDGETGALAEPLRAEMETAANEQAFERAAHLRDRLDVVQAFHGTGGDAVIDTGGSRIVDVLGVAVEGDGATVARLHSEGGKLVDRDRHRVQTPARGDGVPAILAAFVAQFYAERALPDTLLLPEPPESDDLEAWLEAEGVELRVPGAGRESRLIDLAMKNAHQGPDRDGAARALGDTLGIDPPRRIEGFDVSHADGREVVGSDVVFVDGQPAKTDYRRKKLPERNDDYANMDALLTWRAERALEGRDERADPDLLVIDGGRGQLDAAQAAIEAAGWSVPVVSLAKAEEIVHTPDRQFDWDHDATHLHLLQRVRDEAHRFAVQYHQTLRDDVSTVLESVEGIGPARRKRLFRRFGSVEGIRAASEAELLAVPGIGAETAAQLRRRL
ncbi:excinuclease ABC subunit C [Halodesulfurarchaeum formicicum]|uniref:UvrABC system protein C n=1 Tax=Halodesulfurarchaeum formicicum TaxID=1873524 RepID=A0A1D8S779_9EURY|nr:excinuclease ABC subunit C [Halodesulfurarchaeum formicicum]AOW81223.1 excinuclease ABC subunit C [Halodesulfurarchaeum formicicum]APE96566.1 excinuclease ABC subunit C [Halodesulfurarchaeum formicicum]